MGVVVRDVARLPSDIVDAFGAVGVATVHEAQSRTGVLSSSIRARQQGSHIAGSAITVSVPPGDNWMIHVAVEQCRPGDVLVVAPTSPSEAGYIGELLATALLARGVRGVVIDAGVRDIKALREMAFPVWSRHVSALGTVKATLGVVNAPLVCGSVLVSPGDVVTADDDGVVISERLQAADVLKRAKDRDEGEQAVRERYARGELSLDVHHMRDDLERKGLRYL